MATRSMTVICSPQGVNINLYRHWDGYPAVAGAALVEAMKAKGGAADIARALLALQYEPSAHRKNNGIYELADWGPSHQGDLEHVYVVRAENRTVHHYARTRHNWSQDGENYVKWPSTRYSQAEFETFVAKEVADLEARIAKYNDSIAAQTST